MKNVEDVYPLCPMQEGMMFHTLLTPGTGAYVVHISSRIEGEFDIPAFKRSWQKLLERHPILRSAFLWDRVEKPLQVVRAELTLTWNEQDWRSLAHAAVGPGRHEPGCASPARSKSASVPHGAPAAAYPDGHRVIH